MNNFRAQTLDTKEFGKYTMAEVEKNCGVQYIFGFENYYGASVVCSPISYGGIVGLWELAVLDFVDKRHMDDVDYEITYDTPITDDVIGYLNNSEVLDVLRDIQKLSR